MNGYRKCYAKWTKPDKDKYCVISSIHVIQDTKQMKKHNRILSKVKKKRETENKYMLGPY